MSLWYSSAERGPLIVAARDSGGRLLLRSYGLEDDGGLLPRDTVQGREIRQVRVSSFAGNALAAAVIDGNHEVRVHHYAIRHPKMVLEWIGTWEGGWTSFVDVDGWAAGRAIMVGRGSKSGRVSFSRLGYEEAGPPTLRIFWDRPPAKLPPAGQPAHAAVRGMRILQRDHTLLTQDAAGKLRLTDDSERGADGDFTTTDVYDGRFDAVEIPMTLVRFVTVQKGAGAHKHLKVATWHPHTNFGANHQPLDSALGGPTVDVAIARVRRLDSVVATVSATGSDDERGEVEIRVWRTTQQGELTEVGKLSTGIEATRVAACGAPTGIIVASQNGRNGEVRIQPWTITPRAPAGGGRPAEDIPVS